VTTTPNYTASALTGTFVISNNPDCSPSSPSAPNTPNGNIYHTINRINIFRKLTQSCICPRINTSSIQTERFTLLPFSSLLSFLPPPFFYSFIHLLSLYNILAPNTLGTDAIIGIAVAGAVILVAVIVVVIIFGIPSVRQRVFPYKDREVWQKNDD